MKIENALILAAGKGTRMGKVGEFLAKPLWPIFRTTLLEMHYIYLKELGVNNIFINSHHNHEQVEEYIKNKKLSVKNLYEKKLLDVGGAIHNLAREKTVNYSGSLLVVNSDVFLPLIASSIEERAEKMKSSKTVAHLFLTQVPKGSSYAEVNVSGEKVVAISKANFQKSYNTYAGISIINLSLLNPFPGESKFFESVANYKESKVTSSIETDEYWDFGTLERYYHSVATLMSEESRRGSSFLRKLLESNNLLDSSFHLVL